MISTKTNIAKKILSNGDYDKIWSVEDFRKFDRMNVLKAFSELQKEKVIKRIKRGYYYRSKATILGETTFNTYNLAVAKIKKKGSFYCISGITGYNQIGLTTQVPNIIVIATDVTARNYDNIVYLHRRKPVDGGAIERIVLDAIIDIKTIPDTRPEKSILKIKNIIKDGKVSLNSLVKSAMFESPRVKAVIGAIAEEFNFDEKLLKRLKNSLNPVSVIYLNTGNALSHAKEWQIVAEK
jgi:hypothetical protein